jgi:hypothetical protein
MATNIARRKFIAALSGAAINRRNLFECATNRSALSGMQRYS